MDANAFRLELDFAETMARSDIDPLYWCGYKRGLRRAYFGAQFTSNTDHFAWLGLRDDDDPLLAELGRGYRDALEVIAAGGRSALGLDFRPDAHLEGVAVRTGTGGGNL